ncbi:MAG: sulfatase [Verrucomicrobiales bacterium]|nr:sulfatase [Verrucomicrobiales bacterium]
MTTQKYFATTAHLFLWLLLLTFAAHQPESVNGEELRRNVLFIAVDDLRPTLGCYDDAVAVTPNLDALAAKGTTFLRAYCQQAVCNASRASIMTGRRPDTTKVFDLKSHFRDALPDVKTLPQQFREAGYRSLAVGKIYHGAKGHAFGNGIDDELSWSEDGWFPQPNFYHSAEGIEVAEEWFADHREALVQGYPELGEPGASWKDAIVRGLPWESSPTEDEEHADGQIASKGIDHLREHAESGEPFFLAVGFLKPHVPFVAPQRYFDLYPEGSIPDAPNLFYPEGSPEFAHYDSAEMRVYHGIPKERGKAIADEKLRLEMRRAYYACASFIDAQVGRLLASLDELGLRENTVICFWGDHGYHIGENNLWCKRNNYEISCRVPLIIQVPGQESPGARTDALVELVDVLPTLTEACGLPLDEGAEGESLLPLMNAPQREWKTAAFSQYPRFLKQYGKIMGTSMRTERWRFTEWLNEDRSFRQLELYDLENDPEGNKNLARVPEFQELIPVLTEQLRSGWRAARPGNL